LVGHFYDPAFIGVAFLVAREREAKIPNFAVIAWWAKLKFSSVSGEIATFFLAYCFNPRSRWT